ncbi:trigger factor [Alkaliphilus peptidifermentans]|uniref:Trigger factor n=1 Tax=Alkaliphilus peptidifermentans DSM 18978 TaxID=1120976 RepID=A0A1G5LCL4_9FIRM|nr:trigger factor [Alkaliphilus peptidifermentans]SCZ09889.1 trigger factor [Alkaliphilus peptidifermentans DSM 18978]
MNSEIIKQEENKITLKLVVEAADFEKAIDKAYNKMKSRFNIPGFRKGKAPRKIIETHYGVGVFYEEAINQCFPEAYEEALEALKIDPVDRPEIDIEDINKGEDVVFTAVVEVMPEFSVDNYKGIEVEKKEYNVQEEDIENEIKAMLEKNSRMIEVSDRAVKENDLVIIDYKGFVDGEAFEGGSAEKQSLNIGSGQFIPGFEEQLVGKNLGDEVEVKVTFPIEYHAENLAGKDATFNVKIHEIKEKELPALDDEFAKDVSEFDTLDELRVDIKNKLEEQAKNKTEKEFRNTVVENIVKTVDINIPEAVIERQIDSMLKDFEYQLSYQGLNLEYYYQMTGSKEEDLRSQMREDAATRVKSQLVLDKICEQEKIEATEEELQSELQKVAEQYKQEVDKFKENLREEDLKYFKENIAVRKTIDLLVENAKVS